MGKEIIAVIKGVNIHRNHISNLPANVQLRDRAKKFRKAGNYPEVVFWKQVNRYQFYNIDFDRQRIIGNYIVDFYVKALGLIIEIDGTVHNDREDYDEKRTQFLESFNLRVYRISYLRVLHDLSNVMDELEDFIISNYS
jgi:very-short-patch-repair endonuclease